jgi:hypothetical protein
VGKPSLIPDETPAIPPLKGVRVDTPLSSCPAATLPCATNTSLLDGFSQPHSTGFSRSCFPSLAS